MKRLVNRTSPYVHFRPESQNQTLTSSRWHKCEEYNIPATLQSKIDFITPTLHFDAKLKPRDAKSEKEKRAVSQHINPGNPSGGNIPKYQPLAKSNLIKELSDCDKQVRYLLLVEVPTDMS